jgi:hypothetical protein
VVSEVALIEQPGAEGGYTPGSRCLVGRHAACDLRIDDPRVSAEHASIRWVGDHWELRDLGSRNGTFVGGRRLDPSERVPLAAGATFKLGADVELVLVDASAPVASARHAISGAQRFAIEGLLVLPDDDRPEVSIFEDAGGRWVAEAGDETREVRDRDVVVADGDGWIVDLPSSASATMEASAVAPTLETIALRISVSRNEELVEITVVLGDGTVQRVPPRSHNYLLLTLARARIGDTSGSPAERGWVDRDELCRMIASDQRTLNVEVFRVRRQFAALGILGAAGIIARRPRSGELRLGTDRVEVSPL